MKLSLEERNSYTVADLALVDLDESLAAVESRRGVVGSAGLHNRAPRDGFDRQDRADKRDTDAAPEEGRIHGKPVDVDRHAVELPRDYAGELVVDERSEEVLSTCAEVFDGFAERRNRLGADQLRFDAIRTPLNVENRRRGRRIGDVEMVDDDAQSLGT